MKQVLKSLLVLTTVGSLVVAATGAYFTSTVTAADNQIIVGTLALGVDSTRIHTRDGLNTWGDPTQDGYTVAQDVNGVSTSYYSFEPWLNAAPGPYFSYVNSSGADVLPDGNKSYWVAIRNNGSIDLKARAFATGSWYSVPRKATNPACFTLVPDPSLVTVKKVTIYGTTGGSNICKSHEECENIYYGLISLGAGWTYSTDSDVAGADIEVNSPVGNVYLTSDGTSGGAPIILKQNEFVLARVDLNFNTSDNCYQGAEYRYNLTVNGYQLGDTW